MLFGVVAMFSIVEVFYCQLIDDVLYLLYMYVYSVCLCVPILCIIVYFILDLSIQFILFYGRE